MAELRIFVVLSVCEEDPEDSTVTIVKAESKDEAFKKFITEFLGEDREESWMVRIDLNDNPLRVGEYRGGDDENIDFDSMDGSDLERLGLMADEDEEENEDE